MAFYGQLTVKKLMPLESRRARDREKKNGAYGNKEERTLVVHRVRTRVIMNIYVTCPCRLSSPWPAVIGPDHRNTIV